MDIEEFFDQPYTDRQLVEFVDDAKLSKKPFAARVGIAVLEKDELIMLVSGTLYPPLRIIPWLPTLVSKKYRELIVNPLAEGYQTFKTRMLARLDDVEVQQKYKKKGVVINLIGRSSIEHFKLPPAPRLDRTIYVAHPVLRQEYSPLANFHRSTFENKFNELLSLLTHLGAKTIEVYHMSGWGADFAAHLGANLGASNKAKDSSEQQAEQPPKASVGAQQHTEQTLLYKAILQGHAPSMPEGLKWYHTEPNWQQIADQRLHHGLQSFTLHHTYTVDFGINLELGNKLTKAGFDLGGNFKGHTATNWRVTGEF